MANSIRTPREEMTRATGERQQSWKPADLLPEPRPQEGWEFAWIRKSILGKGDPTNVSRNLREGYEVCPLSDHPEMEISVDPGAKESNLVEIGGLLLCKIPVEIADQRRRYYQQMTDGQMASVDAQLDRVNDPRMPVFREHRSETKFGSGR